MRIAIGSDHAGFPLKDTVITAVQAAGHEALDFGTDSTASVDYADFGEKVGRAIQQGQVERGILLCGSGVGICIAANKMRGIFAAICHDIYSAHQGVEHDGMNVLCLGGRVIGPEPVKEIVTAFLSARFVGNDPGEERHARRVGKVKKLEDELGS
ncbi:MAG TPA: ribose 5-phosphate isomerase B [Chloroflexi bacterium]|nr:ribose 5-phosphate isomerase B [Chloroflexota bacterium]HBY06404.1 ribose 5-phosphate isomerase B [Chloroflexota bacterium]